MQGYTRQIKYHLPRHPLIEFAKTTDFIFPNMISNIPLEKANLLFIDGPSNGTVVVYRESCFPIIKRDANISAQQAEIAAIILAFENFPQAFNLYTDSKYVVSLFPAIETALLSGDSKILHLLQQLQKLIENRKEKFYIGHIWRHSGLPSVLSFGNLMADAFTREIIMTAVEKAQQNHHLHHQNALAFNMFQITREQTRQIVKQCKYCPEVYHPQNFKSFGKWMLPIFKNLES